MWWPPGGAANASNLKNGGKNQLFRLMIAPKNSQNIFAGLELHKFVENFSRTFQHFFLKGIFH